MEIISTYALRAEYIALFVFSPLISKFIWTGLEHYLTRSYDYMRRQWKKKLYKYFEKLSFESKINTIMSSFDEKINSTMNAIYRTVVGGFPSFIKMLFAAIDCTLVTIYRGYYYIPLIIPLIVAINVLRVNTSQGKLSQLRKTYLSLYGKISKVNQWNLYQMQNGARSSRGVSISYSIR